MSHGRRAGGCVLAATALAAIAFGETSAAAAPNRGSAAPVVVNLQHVQQSGEQMGGKPKFRHPGGQAKLDVERVAGDSQAPSAGIQQPAAITPAPQQPSAGAGFDGISDAESFCGCYPPDGAVAVGPNHVVAVVNTAFKIWNTSGTVVYPGTSLSALFGVNASCLPNISDPSTQYDAASGGHFVIEGLTYDAAYDSSICIAVSQSGDPTAAWYVYGFSVSPASNLLDFPQMAIGSDAVYLSGNQFANGSTFTGARVYAYNKTAMYAGAAAAYTYHDVGNDAAGGIANSLYPAKGVGVANTAYFLGADNNAATGNSISLWKWSDPFGTDSFGLRGGVTVTTYAQPPKATEPGGTTDTGDVRNLGAAYAAGTVYGVHTIGCNPGGGTVPCVQWYQLSGIDGSPALAQQGIIGGSGESRYYPNLTVDKAGDVLMAYDYASSSTYPGVRRTGRVSSDPVNTLQTEAVTKAGEGFINGTRYGDFSGIQLAPDGCTVWNLEEYAKSGALWGTWVSSMSFPSCGGPPPPPAPTVTGVSPNSGPSAGGTAVTISGANFASGATVRFGTAAATGVSCSSSSCAATSPPGSGTVDVTVTVGSSTSATSSADRFTYVAPPVAPTVTRVRPTSGTRRGGTTVSIRGTGFSTAPGATSITFGSAPATHVSCTSSTSCSAVSPAGVVGTVDVRVTVGGLTSAVSSADHFRYY